jgi:hypothetical protein
MAIEENKSCFIMTKLHKVKSLHSRKVNKTGEMVTTIIIMPIIIISAGILIAISKLTRTKKVANESRAFQLIPMTRDLKLVVRIKRISCTKTKFQTKTTIWWGESYQ